MGFLLQLSSSLRSGETLMMPLLCGCVLESEVRAAAPNVRL